MERLDLCKACEKRCCTRPSLTTDEYVHLCVAVGNDNVLAYSPVWINNGWMFEREGCPALTDKGCCLPHEKKPLNCRLFPWLVVPIYGPLQKDVYNTLLLYTNCPQWKAFGDNYEEARREFENG